MRVSTRLGNPIRATDADSDSLTYALDNANFSISSSGQLSTAAVLNREDDADAATTADAQTHAITITATDPWGGNGTIGVTVTVEGVNEAPMIDSGPTRRDHEENTVVDGASPIADYEATDIDADDTAAELTWSLEGEDDAQFNLTEGTGELTFKESPNFEIPTDRNKDNVYKVTVVVSDDGSPKLTDERQVEVTVTDMEEDGVVTLSTVAPKEGIALSASVDDSDDGVTDVTWQWARTSTSVENEPVSPCPASNAAETWTDIDGAEMDTTPLTRRPTCTSASASRLSTPTGGATDRTPWAYREPP